MNEEITPLDQGPTTLAPEETPSASRRPKRSAQAWALLIADFVRGELRAGKRLPFPLAIPPQTYGMSVRLLQEVGMASAQREAEASARGEPALPRWSLRPSLRQVGISDPHITFTADLHKSLRGRTSPELWSLATGLYTGSTQPPAPKALSPVTEAAATAPKHPFASLPPGVVALELGENGDVETLEGLLAGWLGEGEGEKK